MRNVNKGTREEIDHCLDAIAYAFYAGIYGKQDVIDAIKNIIPASTQINPVLLPEYDVNDELLPPNGTTGNVTITTGKASGNGPGIIHITKQIKLPEAIDFIPISINLEDLCSHEWTEYHGLNESFKFCKKCDKKGS